MRGKLIRGAIGLAILAALALVFFAAYKFGMFEALMPKKPVQEIKQELPAESKPAEPVENKENSGNNDKTENKGNDDFSTLGRPYDLSSEVDVYTLMHYMANTKIEADAIWGTLEATKGRVQKLLEAVNASNWDDKDKLLDILTTWNSGDFSDAVDQHNYLWEMLGGTIGKATRLKK